MNAEQIREELIRLAGTLHGDALQQALQSLREISASQPSMKTDITRNLDRLLKSNEQLLKRLA